MIFTKRHNGILLSDIVNGYRVKKLYIGYSKREAKAMFTAFIKTL